MGRFWNWLERMALKYQPFDVCDDDSSASAHLCQHCGRPWSYCEGRCRGKAARTA